MSLTVSAAESLHNPQTQIIGCRICLLKHLYLTQIMSTQLYQTVLKTFTEQSTGWRNRNMVVKAMGVSRLSEKQWYNGRGDAEYALTV